ncbi:MAG: molybdopterin molybdotransferase MoeA [Methanoregula sp.]|nr:molybdopterin molybdotransferase MoeA [Methanoregula sp.]
MKHSSPGLEQALTMTLEQIKPLGVEYLELGASTDHVAASDLYARVDVPSINSSSKDGYAISSRDVAGAAQGTPVRLKVAGHLAAGGNGDIELKPGTTIRVLTGARIPAGADAVVSEEFAQRDGNDILLMNSTEPGRNILLCGRDVASRSCIIRQGQRITPGLTGLIAAAGHSTVPVFRNPTVAIIGTGDEIVAPGEPLAEGRLYASNIMMIDAWCKRYRMKTLMTVVHDDFDTLTNTLKTMSAGSDAVITSGGAWTGDHDLVGKALERLRWQQYFHRIRIGPGKAVGFGLLDKKPVFILPGGPPSNLIGFLQIALPGLLALAGHAAPGLPRMHARLAANLEGGERDWTRFFFGTLKEEEGFPVFYPLNGKSRLRDMAEAGAIAAIPEGQERLLKGAVIPVQVLG